MSAITGIYSMQHEPVDPELGPGLMRQLQCYPADDARSWQAEGIFLGCRAQWITPESRNEILPYYDKERGLAIAADAIIDNRNDLFGQLQIVREDRDSIPDSLLILLAYEKWGEEAPARLVGDFTFMLWDARRRLLFGARDFSGNRTLYFRRSGGLFSFCTVIHPLLSMPDSQRVVNEDWISEYLANQERTDVADMFSTVYQGIEQLPPAHSITVSGAHVTFSRYYTFQAPPELKLHSNSEYEEAFREVFGQAVKDRLRTHLAAGANLSGGLDSGSVVSFAAEELRRREKPLFTFSSYPVENFTGFNLGLRVADERPYIQETIDHVGNIQPSFLNFPDRNSYNEIDEWLDIMEMPYKFIENSYWLKGIYEQAQSKGVGVLLSGQRGNWSISWGPALDYQAKLIREFRWLSFYREHKLYSRSMEASRRQVLQIVGRKVFPGIGQLVSGKPEAIPELISPELARRTGVHERLKGINGLPAAQTVYNIRRQHFQQPHIWNVNGTAATKLSLKYGVWDRDATNDLRVINFCLSVPEGQYVQNGVDRSLIRRAMEGRLPDRVRLNRKRRGVQGADGITRMLPQWEHFLAELREMIEDPRTSAYLNQPGLAGCLNRLGSEPAPSLIFNTDFRLLTRGLVVYRFLKRLS
ncbi:asparagine synthase-related protein [Paenibacillus sp. MMS20-IR301]|uniref:asparagine synthase-related protein n=1 Tax=Paenibacillus sp. MMS20-IR301 TaxID=2895946 RepID=UPI0028E4C476|nr:asparagine synthase-related protein [Paenibacillus sp. MMS20-IR301]WNS41450.1 asparagine synthase-related protein [Paenibacillus sp. MMS20-IR301]